MFDGRAVTESRIRRFTREHLLPAIHPETAAVTLTAHRLPGEPIPPREAIAAGAEYAPIELGAPLGRAWSTTWLHVTGTVPAHWASDDASAPELLVDLAFTHPDDLPGTVDAAREALRPALSRPAGDSSLTVLATGHAHIDSAWLWPVRETVRKVARTFSNVCTLLEEDPEATVVDLIERPFGEDAPPARTALEHGEDGAARLRFRPFEIKTLRVRRAG